MLALPILHLKNSLQSWRLFQTRHARVKVGHDFVEVLTNLLVNTHMSVGHRCNNISFFVLLFLFVSFHWKWFVSDCSYFFLVANISGRRSILHVEYCDYRNIFASKLWVQIIPCVVGKISGVHREFSIWKGLWCWIYENSAEKLSSAGCNFDADEWEIIPSFTWFRVKRNSGVKLESKGQ